MRLNWAPFNLNTLSGLQMSVCKKTLELVFCFPQTKIREGRREWKLGILDSESMIHKTALFSLPYDSPHELLLRVQMGIPGERDYYDSTDLVWDISKECTTWALRQQVASHYCLPVDKIEIAKYFPERFEWLPISSWVRTGMTEPNRCLREVFVGLCCSFWASIFKQMLEICHVWIFCFDFFQTQQISKRKRKKKQESLQSAPYHLKDGDIIGVKVN